jgi:hypothetical protein
MRQERPRRTPRLALESQMLNVMNGSHGTRTRGLRRDRSGSGDSEDAPKPAFPSGMIHLPPPFR